VRKKKRWVIMRLFYGIHRIHLKVHAPTWRSLNRHCAAGEEMCDHEIVLPHTPQSTRTNLALCRQTLCRRRREALSCVICVVVCNLRCNMHRTLNAPKSLSQQVCSEKKHRWCHAIVLRHAPQSTRTTNCTHHTIHATRTSQVLTPTWLSLNRHCREEEEGWLSCEWS